MSQFLVVDNAIAWAHFRLRGGWRNVLGMTGLFSAAIAGGYMLTQAFAGTSASSFDSLWTNGLLGLQLLLMLYMAPARSSAAVRSDVTGKIIESHRMMPVSAPEAIVGYIIGPNSVLFAITAAATIMGCFITGSGGIPFTHFLIGSGLIASLGLFFAVCSLSFAFQFRLTANALMLPLLFIGAYIAQFVPGLLIFCGPFIRYTVFSLRVGNDLGWPYVVSELAQLLAGSLFFIAACRRYRGIYPLGFTPLMGVALLAIWIAASCVGIRGWSEFELPAMRMYGDAQLAQVIIALLIAMLLALLPISGIARTHSMWRQHLRVDAESAGRRPISCEFIVAVCAVLVMGLALPQAQFLIGRRGIFIWRGFPDLHRGALPRIAIIIVSFLFGSLYLLRIAFRASDKARILMIWIALTWIVPPLLALVPVASSGGAVDYGTGLSGIICAFSPAGALIEVATRASGDTTWGIAFQVLVAVGAFVLFHRTGRPRAPAPA
jgi:hypothetical protein